MEEVEPKICVEEARIPDSLEVGESNDEVHGRRRCKNNSISDLSCIGKRAIECCNRGSEVWTVYRGRFREVTAPLL